MTKINLLKILAIITVILSVPLIGTNLSKDINWKLLDYIVAGILLFSVMVTIVFIAQKIKNNRIKLPLIVSTIFIFLIVWAELAVGIFNSPLSGN